MNCNLTSSGGSVSEPKFNSLVCFDLETTGLPQYGPVKITEFAMVGVLRSHLEQEDNLSLSLPRVLHKLIFTVYPQKPISLVSSKITDLWNDQLEHILPWNRDAYQMLLCFLNRLPAPVCIVAHNGFKFDFPIFKQHLQKIGQEFPDHFIFVDSLPAFQKILKEKVLESSSQIEQSIDMESNNDDLIRAAEEFEAKQLAESTTTTTTTTTTTITTITTTTTKDPQDTPNSKTECSITNRHVKRKSSIDFTAQEPNSNKSKIRKRLFPAGKPDSFKLSDVYSHLHNNQTPESAHNAEGDVITLLKCILKIFPEFLKYADNNNKTLNSI